MTESADNEGFELHTTAVRDFWDTNCSIAEDPLFWMANPLCRHAINLRTTGDRNTWTLDGLALHLRGRVFRRGLSLGCGMGSLERWARKQGVCEEITGLDLSPATLDVARSRAEAEGLAGIRYEIGDMNDLVLPPSSYDIVFVHQALHHVVGLEKLIGRIARILTPDGLLFIDEWTGPSRDEWKPHMIAAASAIYDRLPREWRIHEALVPPILAADPSEAVRSSAILPSLRLFFELDERPYGGHLTAVLLSQLNQTAAKDPRLQGYVEEWLRLEDQDLALHPERSYYAVALGRPRRGIRRLYGSTIALWRRLRLRAFFIARAWRNSLRARLRRVRPA